MFVIPFSSILKDEYLWRSGSIPGEMVYLRNGSMLWKNVLLENWTNVDWDLKNNLYGFNSELYFHVFILALVQIGYSISFYRSCKTIFEQFYAPWKNKVKFLNKSKLVIQGA